MVRPAASPSAILFLIIGTLGGGAGGAAAGFWLGHRAPRATGQVPSTRPTEVHADAAVRPGDAQADAAQHAGSDAAAGVGGTVDGGSDRSAGTEVCVEVREAGDRPVAGALITWRSAVWAGARTGGAVGELGVYAGTPPFPDDVIARGAVVAAPAAQGGAGAGAGRSSDAAGRVCLRATGPIVVTAVHDERTATAELLLPAAESAPGGSRAPVAVVLRLGLPADALCRLTTPTDPSAIPGEPVSETAAGDIEGRVVDGRGFGVVGVRVDAQIGSSRSTGITDARGAFRLTGLPRGALTLTLQKKGYAPLRVSRRADEGRSDVSVTLLPGGGIAGSLRDRRRGTVPAGATLVLLAGGSSQTLPIGRDGHFEMTGLPTGAGTLRARAPGFAALSLPVQIPAGEGPDEITLRDVVLDLEVGAEVRGQVRTPSGSSAGVVVEASSSDGTVLGRVLSDDHGDFRLGDLPAGRLRITASAGTSRATATIDVESGANQQVHLELQ